MWYYPWNKQILKSSLVFLTKICAVVRYLWAKTTRKGRPVAFSFIKIIGKFGINRWLK